MDGQNPDLQQTLDEAVGEVLGILTGMDLTYAPEMDRYRAITRQLNRAVRATALDQEWSYYSDVLAIGEAEQGQQVYLLPTTKRPRVIDDDAVRLVDTETEMPVKWAYFLPRDALHKYADRMGLWCTVTRKDVIFSRPFWESEAGLQIQIPVMREPRLFKLPATIEHWDPCSPGYPTSDGLTGSLRMDLNTGSDYGSVDMYSPRGPIVPDEIRDQLVDFPYPDLVVARAAYFYAQTDPVMQPRAQTLEQEYKTLMYALVERDTRATDTPYQNEFDLGIQNGLAPRYAHHYHPHAHTY